MALAIDVSKLPAGMSKREVAVSAGLAKKGRGPFSKEARAFLDKIEAQGYSFATPAPVVKLSDERIDTKDMDLEAFRVWAGTKGYTVGDRGRIKNDYLVEYVAEVPDYPRRVVSAPVERVKSEKVETVKVNRNSYDPKIVRRWAIDNNKEVPARGKLSNTLIAEYLEAHKDAETPAPVRENTENLFAATPDRVRPENSWEGIDIDGKTKIRLSYRDVPADHSISIGWINPSLAIHAFSRIDSDTLIRLNPVAV